MQRSALIASFFRGSSLKDLIPPAPAVSTQRHLLTPVFSPPTHALTPPQSSRKSDQAEKQRNVKPQGQKKHAEKPQR